MERAHAASGRAQHCTVDLNREPARSDRVAKQAETAPRGRAYLEHGIYGGSDYGLLRAIVQATTANATNPHSATCEPDRAPKNTAIRSSKISEPPCARFQLRSAQRYSAPVR
jgi:hypothetical protein